MQARLKAQVAMEFMILAGFFLLVFVIAVGYFASLQKSEITSREYLLGREIGLQMADEAHAALLGGKGYEKTFTLPPTIAGTPYELSITNRREDSTMFAEVSWLKGSTKLEYVQPLPFRNARSGAVMNIDLSEPVTVSNDGDDVEFSQ